MTASLRADGARPNNEFGSRGEEAAATRAAGGMQYLVLDCTFVTTIDSTALAALVKVCISRAGIIGAIQWLV